MLIVETKRKGNKITIATRRTRPVFIGRTWYAHYGRLAAVNTNGPYVTRMYKHALREMQNMQIRVVFVYTLFIRSRTYTVHGALSTVAAEVVIR